MIEKHDVVITMPLPKRRYERTPCSTPAKIRIKRGLWTQTLTGVITDVSPTGAKINISSGGIAVKENDTVTLEWLVPPVLGNIPKEKKYEMPGRVVRFQGLSNTQKTLGVRIDQTIPEAIKTSEARLERTIVAGLMVIVAAVIIALKSRNVISFWYQPIFQVYSLAAAAFILSRVGLSMFYRQPKDNGFMTAVTITLSVKNEETKIAEAIQHIFESRYPKDLMELIVIDDGSTDNTWHVLKTIEPLYPRMRIFRFEKNKGKRHGMALGAEKAKGNILIYIDSDSFLEPEGIYRIVQPFYDKRVGAVAGHTMVFIEPDNFISKMEAVRYFVSQRVMKASESIFNAVTCCPGPFSAYRREAVMPILSAWLNQTFLGTEATFGDDRSLTNFILRNYRVLYHAGARCATYVPDRWSVFFRQQLRWKKSWIRETTIAARFMYQKSPVAAISYYVSVMVTVFSPIIALRAMLYLPIVLDSFTFLPYLAGLLLVYVFFGLTYQFHTLSRKWIHGLAFALLYVFFLSFQNYYAVLTVRRNHWGTR